MTTLSADAKRPYLYIFDADGTLCDRSTGELLPAVLHFAGNLHKGAYVAIATNQGGPACHDAGWPWSDKYPTLAEVEARYGAIAQALGATLYMSLAYQTKNGGLIFPAGLPADDPRLNPQWRKPLPGMLLQAMADAGVPPMNVRFIGDGEEDKAAAEAAGIRFIHADEFFPHGNPQWQEIEDARDSYKASVDLLRHQEENAQLWREVVAEQKKDGRHSLDYMVQFDAETRNEDQYREWEDQQRHLYRTVRLRASNLFVEVDPTNSWVKERWDADPDGWRTFFQAVKGAFDGHTYAECVGTDLGGLLTQPLKEPMEYGMISFWRAGNPAHIMARLHVGDPRREWSWML